MILLPAVHGWTGLYHGAAPFVDGFRHLVAVQPTLLAVVATISHHAAGDTANTFIMLLDYFTLNTRKSECFPYFTLQNSIDTE
jgi:hypothetical protein